LLNLESSNENQQTASTAANELDDLFGSIQITSQTKINNQLDDCLPLFTTNQQSIFEYKQIIELLLFYFDFESIVIIICSQYK